MLISEPLASQVAEWAEAHAQMELFQNARKQELDQAKARCLEAFRLLTSKYNVPPEDLWEDNRVSPLGPILEKLEASEQLDKHEIDWLEVHELHRLLATMHYRDYKHTTDIWSLVKACKHLRKANLPEKVISATERASRKAIQNKEALSALLTTRGGAFRGLKNLEAAKRSATEAIRESPTSFHPHNLLGAVLYEEGSPAAGDKHFSEAVRLGSTLDQNLEIRRALERSASDARQRVVEYLFSKDPTKYAWVLEFAPRL